MKMIFRCGCFLLLLFMAACGFKLRGFGEDALVLPATYIVGSQNSPLTSELANLLRQIGVNVVEEKNLAMLLLKINTDKRDRQVLSVGASGKVEEYELSYEVSFSVLETAVDKLLIDRTVKVFQDLTFDAGQVVAKDVEEEQLYGVMRQQVIQEMVRHLRALNMPTASEPPAIILP